VRPHVGLTVTPPTVRSLTRSDGLSSTCGRPSSPRSTASRT